MFTGLRVKYSLLLSILIKLEFSQQIFGKYENVNFTTISPVEDDLFLADRRTDMYTRRSQQSLFAILRTRFLYHISQTMVPRNTDNLISLISIGIKPAPAVLHLAQI